MERAAPFGAATRQPNRDRDRYIGAPVMRSGIVEDLVERDAGEIGKLHFHNRPHALERSADGRAHHGVLADRRIQDASGKFFGQSFGRLECAAEGSTHVLSVDEDAFVIAQESRLRFTDSLEISDAHNENDEARMTKLETMSNDEP